MQEGRGKTEQIDLVVYEYVLLDRPAGHSLRTNRFSAARFDQGLNDCSTAAARRQSHREGNSCEGQIGPRAQPTRSSQHSKAFLDALDVLEQGRRGTGFIASSTDGANFEIQVDLRRDLLEIPNRVQFGNEVAQALKMSHDVIGMRTRVTCWVLRVIG
jgi:hypothetical protein